MNTKKIVAMIIALIMTSGMLVGCGNSVDHKESEVSSTVETTIDKDVEEESEDESETAEETNATETADKETSNKAEKPNDNKVADKSDKDKGSVQANNSSVSKPNSGNANNNGSTSKPSTPAKPNKPSGNSNSGSVSEPSKPAEKPVTPQKPSESQKPAPHVHNYNTVVSSTNGDCSHVGKVTKKCSCGATVTENGSYGNHSWQDQYKEVHHDAKYENRPVYKWVAYDKCRKCGYETEHKTGNMIDHIFECGGTYTTFEKQIQTGTESVQVEKPWTERVPDGKKCTICGTHKH